MHETGQQQPMQGHDASAENKNFRAADGDRLSWKVQAVELAVFLFLIFPASTNLQGS